MAPFSRRPGPCALTQNRRAIRACRMQAPLASADRRSAARRARVKEPARRREGRAPQTPPPERARVVRVFAGALGAGRRRVAGRMSRARARRTEMREPSLRRARKPSAGARGRGRGRVRETPQTCPGPPEGQRSPSRGAQGRGAPVKGASGHLRRSWCPEAAISGGKAPRGAAGGGKAAPASAFHRPNCASGSEHEGRRGVQGSGKWNILCYAPRRLAK